MNAKPGVQITARQKITISIVLMLAPASWSIRKVCGYSDGCQAKNVVQRTFSGTPLPSPKSIHYLSPGAIDSTGAGKWNGGLVMRKLALQIAVTLFLFGKADPLQANTYQIDLTKVAPIGTLFGSCYCSPIDDGPIYSFEAQPGDIFDFGKIEFYAEGGGNKGLPIGEFSIAFGMPEVNFTFA
jgi:hypothetical protein